MSLPRKDSNFRSLYLDQNGLPLRGSQGDILIQQFLAQQARRSEAVGKVIGEQETINKLQPYLEALSNFNLDDFNNLPSLKEDKIYSKVWTFLLCYRECIKAIKSQINNNNKVSFKAGSRELILKFEKMLGKKRGEIINNYISSIEQPYTPIEKVSIKAKTKKVKKTKEKSPEDCDPTDVLINTEI